MCITFCFIALQNNFWNHTKYLSQSSGRIFSKNASVYFFFFFPPFFFPFLPFPPFPPFPPPPSSSSAWAALARFLPRGVFAYQPCKCQLKLVNFFLEYFYKCLNINDRIISCACYAASRACMTHYVTLRITLHEAFRNKHNLARWSYLSWEIVQLSS